MGGNAQRPWREKILREEPDAKVTIKVKVK